MGAPDEDAAHVHADGRAAAGFHGAGAPTCRAMSKNVTQSDERHEQAEADGVRHPLDPEREPLARERPGHEDEHAPAVEGRDRQDVDEGEVGRQERGQAQGRDRRPADQNTSPTPTAMPTGPATPGSSVGWFDDAPAELGQPVRDEPEGLAGLGAARSPGRHPGRAGERALQSTAPNTPAMPSAPLPAATSAGLRSVTMTSAIVPPPAWTTESVTVWPAFARERVDEPLAALEVVEALTVDGDDQVRRRGRPCRRRYPTRPIDGGRRVRAGPSRTRSRRSGRAPRRWP